MGICPKCQRRILRNGNHRKVRGVWTHKGCPFPAGKPICRWCSRGDYPVRLDADGVRSDVSGKRGVFSHAYGDRWWPCPLVRKAGDLIAVIKREG